MEHPQPGGEGFRGLVDLVEACAAAVAGHFGLGQAGVLFAVDKLAQLLALAAKRFYFSLAGRDRAAQRFEVVAVPLAGALGELRLPAEDEGVEPRLFLGGDGGGTGDLLASMRGFADGNEVLDLLTRVYHCGVRAVQRGEVLGRLFGHGKRVGLRKHEGAHEVVEIPQRLR